MKIKELLITVIISVGLFVIPSITDAAPSASIIYNETNLGGGEWKYEYTFFNTSTDNESLYSVWFDFAQTSTVTGSAIVKVPFDTTPLTGVVLYCLRAKFLQFTYPVLSIYSNRFWLCQRSLHAHKALWQVHRSPIYCRAD